MFAACHLLTLSVFLRCILYGTLWQLQPFIAIAVNTIKHRQSLVKECFGTMTDMLSIDDSRGGGRGRSRSNSNGSTTLANRDLFPSKLYEMLESVESLGLSHIVCWLPHGESFKVIDPTQFMDLVVPKFFKATKYRSFQRQLNLWGFKR